MEDRIVEKLCGENAANEIAMRAVLRARCSELGYDTASTLERTLIDHVVLSWLRFQDISHWYQNHMDKSYTLAVGAFWEKKLTAAHTRYLQGLETLAKVRRLASRTPEVWQVNIGQQQVVVNN
jgi:hypothetical protein